MNSRENSHKLLAACLVALITMLFLLAHVRHTCVAGLFGGTCLSSIEGMP
jgi:hypothetical protein